jgi:hypothetical protein
MATDRLHARLSVEAGPLLAAAEIADTLGVRKLLFSVSHLVADGYSMVLLLEDLIDAYGALRSGATPSLTDPLAIDAWTPRYHRYVNSEAYCSQLEFWESRPWKRALSLPRDLDDAAGNVAGSACRINTQLDARTTQAVHADIPRQLGMTPRDLLTAALARVLMRWSGGEAIVMHLHDAGRKDLESALGVDLSRVVGAFSIRQCLFLERAGDAGLLGEIRALQRQIATTPHGGAGLLALQSVCERPDVAARARRIHDAEVWFNYFGAVGERLTNHEGVDAEIPSRLSAVIHHIQPVTHEAGTPRGRVFSVAARVTGGLLDLSWEYSSALHRESTVRALAEQLTAELERIAAAARN